MDRRNVQLVVWVRQSQTNAEFASCASGRMDMPAGGAGRRLVLALPEIYLFAFKLTLNAGLLRVFGPLQFRQFRRAW